MKTNDFFTRVTSAQLTESFEKSFGSRVNLDKYTREELEDMRNKLRTRVFQHEGASKYNDLLTNETYQKDMAMLQILNTRIKEMLGESLKQMATSLNIQHTVVENSPSHTATEKQIRTRIRQIQYDRKLSGTDSNARELAKLKQQLKDLKQKRLAEATGDDKFDAMMRQMKSSQLTPSEIKYFKRMDLLFAKLGELGQRVVRDPAEWYEYKEDDDQGDTDQILSKIEEYLHKTVGITEQEMDQLMDVINDTSEYNTITNFAWAVKEGQWQSGYIEPWENYKLNYARTGGIGLGGGRNFQENSPASNKAVKNSRDAAQQRGITQDKHGTYQLKESKMKENDEFAIKKSEIPAAQRKAKGGDWKVSRADLDKEASRSKSSAGGLAREKSKLRSQGVMEEPADKSQIPAVQRKAKAKGGDDWKVSLADLDKEASKSRSTKAGLDREKANLKSKGMMEADKPSAGMTKKEKSAVVKKARAGKDIGKPGKGFAKVEKAAKKGGARDPKAVAAAAMWKQQAKESFRRNVRMVNESLAYYIMEDEEGKAKTITAASDIVNDFTSWMQRVGQYQTKALIELADDIRADFGLQQSEQFKQAVAPALAAALESLTQQREAISNAVAVLAGEDMPTDMMGVPPEGEVGPGTPDMEPMEPATPDEMNEPGDEFGASDAAAGAGATGRELRESAFARRLAESHSIISKLAK